MSHNIIILKAEQEDFKLPATLGLTLFKIGYGSGWVVFVIDGVQNIETSPPFLTLPSSLNRFPSFSCH